MLLLLTGMDVVAFPIHQVVSEEVCCVCRPSITYGGYLDCRVRGEPPWTAWVHNKVGHPPGTRRSLRVIHVWQTSLRGISFSVLIVHDAEELFVRIAHCTRLVGHYPELQMAISSQHVR